MGRRGFAVRGVLAVAAIDGDRSAAAVPEDVRLTTRQATLRSSLEPGAQFQTFVFSFSSFSSGRWSGGNPREDGLEVHMKSTVGIAKQM
ncbi:hypothetical protein DFH11DRAFT_1732165 [Phellopilus nigrolimitatus]|nr:hypothetical protein DFH11DRAFT_1732165 [Phellopilus nigrolimitatus]